MKKISIILLILCFIFTAGYTQPEPYILRGAVHNYLKQSNSDFAFVLIAEIQNDSTSTAIFWPAILNGAIVDDKIIAVEFSKENDKWTAVELFQGEDLTKLVKDVDTKAIRKEGSRWGADSISIILMSQSKLIGAQLDSTPQLAANTIEQISTTMSLDVIVKHKLLSNVVLQGVKSADIYDLEISEGKGKAKLELYYQVKAMILNVSLRKQSSGWIIDEVFTK